MRTCAVTLVGKLILNHFIWLIRFTLSKKYELNKVARLELFDCGWQPRVIGALVKKKKSG
jgi:hypothetical protein